MNRGKIHITRLAHLPLCARDSNPGSLGSEPRVLTTILRGVCVCVCVCVCQDIFCESEELIFIAIQKSSVEQSYPVQLDGFVLVMCK